MRSSLKVSLGLVFAFILSAFALQANAEDMMALAKKSGCLNCHAVDKKVVGPAWMDVSKKYKGVKSFKYSKDGSSASDAKSYPLVQGLVKKVSNGGKGNWTEVTGGAAMAANDPSGKKKGDITKLVKFILGLSSAKK